MILHGILITRRDFATILDKIPIEKTFIQSFFLDNVT